MFVLVVLAIAFTTGAVVFSLQRGRGGASGLLLCLLASVAGATVGAFGAQALLLDPSRLALSIGALCGALVYAAADLLTFGRARPALAPERG